MPFDVSYIPGFYVKLLRYLPQTLLIVILALLLGLLLGIVMAYARRFHVFALNGFVKGLVSYIRGTPPLVQLFVVYYALTKLSVAIGVDISAFVCAVIALGINAAGFMSDALLSALYAVDPGQTEAAYAVGMTRVKALYRIVLPQALQIALPNLLSICFTILKESALVFQIGVMEIMNAAKQLSSSNFRTIEAYIAAALIYMPICITLDLAARKLVPGGSGGREVRVGEH